MAIIQRVFIVVVTGSSSAGIRLSQVAILTFFASQGDTFDGLL